MNADHSHCRYRADRVIVRRLLLVRDSRIHLSASAGPARRTGPSWNSAVFRPRLLLLFLTGYLSPGIGFHTEKPFVKDGKIVVKSAGEHI